MDKRLVDHLILRSTIFVWNPSHKVVPHSKMFLTHTLSSVAVFRITQSDFSTEKFLRSTNVTFLWKLKVLGIRKYELQNIDNVVIVFEKLLVTTAGGTWSAIRVVLKI